ncbi:phosphoribosylformylglycinamidine synthase, purS protein [Campylobacter jejuni subsp. jejuni HN-CJD07035]|uniref:phosphoribosylformylglycinamidine synthase subunit PurS n=1 Tax=Campylobacter jejuni TaxID=197 RepID=UPI000068DEF0|nr:phosphoribosylformylglycinamidine synthase subunit PurS [Campylobacter jejuni]ALF91544.1 phosphoribosylformylglycinamidine synthase PurLQS, PurS subunit [Campylobacter jejuni subsp. jejuni]ALF93178.1 phosphoribosylformylglycinamidine synthase PurLQS, PurS subunit [Campylobacter jejuni subsp. jejuni]EAJ7463376.1 phosphoribosylformylglycinamidine synthase subunit PurS [Campylobacter jejuni]EAK1060185.1 phosphoribosylformylglycinamidine synthase subunit PurS [Campylobacter jejuni]EAK1065287.1 
MEVIVNIFLKNGVLDPQGKAVEKALHSLNFNSVKEVKIAKQIKISLDEKDEKLAKEQVKKMCEELLVNSVIEDYELVIEKE